MRHKPKQQESVLTRHDLFLIFALALTIRIAWQFFSGIPLESAPDYGRYAELSDQIIAGKYNLEKEIFIVAPLFPYVYAAFKLLFGAAHNLVLGLFQAAISSVGAIFVGLTSQILFRRRAVSLTSACLYAIYPTTLYYVHLPSQESLFQSFFIVSFYLIVRYTIVQSVGTIFWFSISFVLALLSKSHVILFIPFVVLIVLLVRRPNTIAIKHAVLFLFLVFFLTLPNGIYNLNVNGVYTLSSSGSGAFLLTGRNERFYEYMSGNSTRDGSSVHKLPSQLDIYEIYAPSGIGLTHKERQSIYAKAAIDWTLKNPIKSLHLALLNVSHFLLPGYSYKAHPFTKWLAAFLLNLPVYLGAYFSMLRSFSSGHRRHLPALSIFLVMLLFSVVFYAQNRFRLITLEPIYIIYASPWFVSIFSGLRTRFASSV